MFAVGIIRLGISCFNAAWIPDSAALRRIRNDSYLDLSFRKIRREAENLCGIQAAVMHNMPVMVWELCLQRE